MFGNRGIYYDGWTAVTRHSIPWELTAESTPFNDDVWELYDTNTDWTQAHDLAAEMPDKLAELQRQLLIEAARYNVLPLDDRQAAADDPGHGRPPDADQGRHPGPLPRHGHGREHTSSTSRTSRTP